MVRVSLSQLVSAARSGDAVISFPTDTVPALAVRPDRSELIFRAKQRDTSKPLILMGASAEDLWPYVTGQEADLRVWQQTAEQYWPGALTMVLPASDRLPAEINPTDPTTIGIRVPDSAIARYILSQTGPLATTSANRSGQPPLQAPADIDAQFPDVLLLPDAELAALVSTTASDGQPAQNLAQNSGVPSTVARWESDRWVILRQGQIRL